MGLGFAMGITPLTLAVRPLRDAVRSFTSALFPRGKAASDGHPRPSTGRPDTGGVPLGPPPSQLGTRG